MGARPVLVASLIATVVTGCLLRPSGLHQSDARTQPDSGGGGGGGGGGGIDGGGGGGGVDAPIEGGVDAPIEGGVDAPTEGGMDAMAAGDPCAMATPFSTTSITCTMNATSTGSGTGVMATADFSDQNCVWDDVTLSGTNPSASVLVSQAPTSSAGHAYLKVTLGTQPDVSLYINHASGIFTPSAGDGWGSAATGSGVTATSLCVRIVVMSGTLLGEYYDPVHGWQQFATTSQPLDSPLSVAVGVIGSSAVMAKATFSELGTGTQ